MANAPVTYPPNHAVEFIKLVQELLQQLDVSADAIHFSSLLVEMNGKYEALLEDGVLSKQQIAVLLDLDDQDVGEVPERDRMALGFLRGVGRALNLATTDLVRCAEFTEAILPR